MTLNFPDTANTGDVFHDSTSGFSYEWNGTVWISTDPQRAANIKELDDISSGFNGSTTQFNLTVSSSAVEPVSDSQLLISVGGVMQNPTNDYTVSGSTITFTTAPSAGLTFFGTFLGQALSLNNVQNGTVEFASFKTGTAGVGIKSDGTAIGVGITQIDFVGSGNTVVSVGNTVSVYIAAGIDTTGTSKFNNITATGNITAAGDLNVTGNLTYEGVTATNQKISGVTTTGGLNVLGITSTKDLRSVGVATLTTGSATNFTVTNLVGTSATATTLTATNFNTTHTTVSGVATVTGIIDGNGGANISGGAGLVASSAKISDLTSGRVTYAGSSGELQDSGNLTFNGSELTAASATVSDLTDNRVVIAGSSGALEDSSNLTFDGSTLTVNGDMNVQGELTYQEVTEIDSVGFVTARKGLRVTNGGVIVTAGLSTFSDDVKLAGANYNITFDRSADDLIFDDNAQAKFGTGGDLSIYHNGSHSYIVDSGTGTLRIETSELGILSANGSETMAQFVENAQVSLRYDNTERLETTSVGVNITGNVDADSLNIAGVSTFVGDVTFDGNTAGRDVVWDRSDNALEFADDAYLKIGTGNDMNLFHNNSNSYITNSTGQLLIRSSTGLQLGNLGGEAYFAGTENGAATIYYNDNAKLATESSGVAINGKLTFDGDGISNGIELGADADLILYHDNSNGYFDNEVGDFYIRNAGSNPNQIYIQGKGGEHGIIVNGDGAIELYHDNSVKLATTSSGISVTGAIVDSTHGNVRDIPATTKTSGYTLVASDFGKVVYISTGGVTIPNSVMSGGNVVTIINNSGSDQTITQASGLTLYNTADASTGNRTLAGRGMCTIWFQGGSTAYISGAGLS